MTKRKPIRHHRLMILTYHLVHITRDRSARTASIVVQSRFLEEEKTRTPTLAEEYDVQVTLTVQGKKVLCTLWQ